MSFLFAALYHDYADLYIFSGLPYVFFGILTSFIRPLRNYLISLWSLFLIWLAYTFKKDIFSQFEYVYREGQSYPYRVEVLNSEAFYAYVIFNVVVLVIGYFFVFKKLKVNR